MTSVIIVGGGVIGLLMAYELERAGLQVTLIDRQKLGQESSWAGGGILSPLYPWRYPEPITRLAMLSQQIYPELIRHMQGATGLEADFLPSGMLILGDYDTENPSAWADRYSVNMQAVDKPAIQQLAPEIADIFNSGWWFPEIHQVRNPRLVALIKAYLQTRPVNIIENDPVTALLLQKDRVSGVQTLKNRLEADAVVIAGGAWTSKILEPTGLAIGIKPIKGQMLLLKGPPDSVRRITLSEDRYIIPRKDGRILVGSTTEDCGFNKDTSPLVKQELHDYAVRTIPILGNFEVELHWSGLRPGSENDLPVIGAHPKINNLFINSGHYRNGLVMAPASTRLLTEIMLKKPTCLEHGVYAPCDKNHNKN